MTFRKQIARRIGSAAVFAGVMLLAALPAYAQLTIKLVAVNPSEQEKQIDVKEYLPRELDNDDIESTGDLKLDYDINKQSYYVTGSLTFAPKESKTFEIKVKDVWQIAPEEIDILKRQLDGNLNMLKDKPEYDNAVELKQHIEQELDYIMERQNAYSENIGRRVEEYRANNSQLQEIREKVYNLNFLQRESKSLAQIDQSKTVKFMVEVENPKDEPQTFEHKHYLPAEIRQPDVVEGNGFDVRYDNEKGQAYLHREETLEPGEKKSYTFVIKDVWQLPLNQLDVLKERADAAMTDIEGSSYEASGRFLYEALTNNLTLIQGSQSVPASSVREHIARYRTDVVRFEQAKSDVKKLEEILAIVRAQKLEELESSRVKNVLQKLRALRGLQALSEALFKKGISVTMTWRIIFGTIAFIAAFSTIHFVIWAKRSGKMGEERHAGEIEVVAKPGAKKDEEDA